VTARLGSGATLADASNASFSIVTGTAAVKVTTPNTAVQWGVGSTQTVKWTHNFGTSSYVRIDLSRDGGATWQAIVPSVKNSSATSGSVNWVVTAPLTTAARIRVSWLNGNATDTSDVSFTIANPYITVSSPSTTSTSWGYGTTRKQTWTTNLGVDRVEVRMSTDGGATFPYVLGAATASSKTATIVVPTLPQPTSGARVAVVWLANSAVAGTNPVSFRVEPPFVTLTKPDGLSHNWTIGTSQTITWANNLGTSESVKLELSTDGGTTYGYVLVGTTTSDGSQSLTVQSAWRTESARVRVTWLKNAAVSDGSNALFAIR